MRAEVVIAQDGRPIARRLLEVGQRLVLGSQGDVPLQDPLVSPQHVQLELRAEGVYALDLDSATGTLLGGQPLPVGQAVGLPAGSVLQVGSHRVRLQAAAAPAPTSGTMLSDYENLGELGRGGNGIVFHARHRASGREVAVKQLHTSVGGDQRQRFLREGEVSKRIQDARVVQVFETRVEGPVAFLVMELVRGGSLSERLDRGPLSIPEVVRIGSALAHGLVAVHAQGVVHRDIKPANVLLTREGGIKLADFGLAKDARSVEQLTKTRQGMGTLAYLSPEQAQDSKRVDARSDLYGVGSVLYHTLAGRPPFTTQGMAVLHEILDVEPRPVAELRADCPPRLAEVVHWLLEKDPDDRPPSAEFLVKELDAVRVG